MERYQFTFNLNQLYNAYCNTLLNLPCEKMNSRFVGYANCKRKKVCRRFIFGFFGINFDWFLRKGQDQLTVMIVEKSASKICRFYMIHLNLESLSMLQKEFPHSVVKVTFQVKKKVVKLSLFRKNISGFHSLFHKINCLLVIIISVLVVFFVRYPLLKDVNVGVFITLGA